MSGVFNQSGCDIEWLFGGSFDPIHLGHVAIIKRLYQLNQWPIRILPCSVPALKQANTASFEQRIEMLKLAVADIPQVLIDQREAKVSGPSYTIDSLESLHQENPHRRLVMVIGDDHLADLGQWHHSNKLHQYCHCLLVNRPGYSIDNIKNTMSQLNFSSVANWQQFTEYPNAKYFRLQEIEELVSSSQIRARTSLKISNKEAIPEQALLPAKVKNYIETHLIYR